jgi:hypothetical protein
MAQIIPSDISQLALGKEHAYELETLDALKRELSDDYFVFHNTHWSLEDGKKNRFGEIDFIVLNGSGKAVVIEQKNGPLVERKDGLIKAYRDKETNVGDQLHRSLDAIREKFKRQHTAGKKIALDYLVYIPEHRITNLNTPTLDNSRIVDALDKNGLARRIQKIFDPANSENSEHAKAVFDFFCKSYEIVPDVHAYKEAQARAYTRLSGGLIEVIDNLEVTPFRLRVKGVAGCGKSQAARHFYDKAVTQGKRPLLLCFNRPLCEHIKSSVPSGGEVYTWYGLCDTFLKERGYTLDYSRMKEDRNFWKDAVQKVKDYLIESNEPPKSWRFDTIIVDEGQDAEPHWHEILDLLVNEDTEILWLEDPVQNLRKTGAFDRKEYVVYNARDNYRTPARIARFIEQTMPFEIQSKNDVPGMEVGVHTYDKPEQQKEIVDRIVKELIKKKFSPEEIVVLTCGSAKKSALSASDQIAGLPVRRFTEEYDSQGNQVFTNGRIQFESIYRFKGQQAPAVVLVDVDPKNDRDQRALFSGMTRATVRLDMVINVGNPTNELFLER